MDQSQSIDSVASPVSQNILSVGYLHLGMFFLKFILSYAHALALAGINYMTG